jgi:hypothetical protein
MIATAEGRGVASGSTGTVGSGDGMSTAGGVVAKGDIVELHHGVGDTAGMSVMGPLR